MIFNVLRADLDEMAGELERSYRYVLQCYPGRAPGPVILVGGGAAFRGLDVLLHERLGVEVFSPEQSIPPDCRLDFSACNRDGQLVISEFAGAIGLAIPEGSNDG
jgi:Tfp pilus assembly PilM family ATPase